MFTKAEERERERKRTRRQEKNARNTISFFMFFFLTPLLFVRKQRAFEETLAFLWRCDAFFFFFFVSRF